MVIRERYNLRASVSDIGKVSAHPIRDLAPSFRLEIAEHDSFGRVAAREQAAPWRLCLIAIQEHARRSGKATDPKAAAGRYSPPVCTDVRKRWVSGYPSIAHVSTSYVERSNLSIRTQNRRFTRLTNAFSKKFENHVHALALYFMFYNFVRVHKTLRMSPAMAAGVFQTLWTMEDIANRIEASTAKPAKRGPYKKRVTA